MNTFIAHNSEYLSGLASLIAITTAVFAIPSFIIKKILYCREQGRLLKYKTMIFNINTLAAVKTFKFVDKEKTDLTIREIVSLTNNKELFEKLYKDRPTAWNDILEIQKINNEIIFYKAAILTPLAVLVIMALKFIAVTQLKL
ncbi:MAG: hypothetical protein GY853_07780 [PVC group bacterium]|nr:hypothetical protein [PVC group bacterium]